MNENRFKSVKGYILAQADKLWTPEIESFLTYNELFRAFEEVFNRGYEEATKDSAERLNND